MKLLDSAYKQENYLDFLSEKFNFQKLLGLIDIKNESDDVDSFKQSGFITTADNKKLPVFEIYIKANTKLERNRVGLRNLVAKQITIQDGALAVFVNKEEKKWRFSFIAIEYKLGKKGVEKEQTVSKRFTYLLGEGTQTRTAKERFKKINKQSTLDDLKAAFAVEPLSKEFYDKLYKWYEKVQNRVIFPNDEGEDKQKHIQNSLIRLLTRLLFIWFLKEKQLINPDLFNQNKLKNIIDWQKDSSFYKAILQNLFFATLNREIIDRRFRTTTNNSANSNNYLITNVYRYQQYFINHNDQTIIKLFEKTPFLNGGLFECLDREATNEEKEKYDKDKSIRKVGSAIRIDGFSDRTDNELALANQLFFNDDEQDLGLINLFSQYQFTVEESTPTDIEVALDPELLGKVFENLLASYNPETGEQARKATGSFYTPREIVNYMVDESLKGYLTQKMPSHDGDNKLYKDRLNDLFSASDKTGELKKDGTNLIYDEEVPKLIEAISQIKILDPAVGSGAFPMGLLQRMVALLAILDPDNEQWKAQKIKELPSLLQITQDIKITEKIQDDEARLKAQEVLKSKKKAIEAKFKNQDHNYLRKLYLIENCIYGVDIQPIAIQICKLRFFISLTIEQNIKQNEENYGIKALPNLEIKLIAANSLLPLGEMPKQKGLFDSNIEELQQQLLEIRHKYFTAKTLKTKRKYRKQDQQTRQEMLGELDNKDITTEIKNNIEKVVHWDLYNQNAVADWFDPEWQFGVKDGFDIVLGNPPYIRQENIKQWKEKFKRDYQVFTGTADIYTYFYEKGFNLLSKKGHLCYITSNKWMRAKYGEKLRYFFKNKTNLEQIIDFEGKQIFENATVDTNILLTAKSANKLNFNYQKQLPDEKNPLFIMAINDLQDNAYTLQPPKVLALKKKIEQIGTPLKEWDVNIYRGVLTGYNQAFIIDTKKKEELIKADPKSAEIIKPILRGRDIKAYQANWAGLWIVFIPWHFPLHKNKSIKGASKEAEQAFQNQYPIIYNHLLQYKEKLSKRNKVETGIRYEWYAMQRCANTYYDEFEKEKIVYSEIVRKPQFHFDNKKYYIEATAFIMSGKNLKFLISLLHSRLTNYAFKNFYAGGGLGDKGYRYKKIFLQQLPIPQISKSAQQPFIDLVDKILTAKKDGKDTTTLETQIDKMVYQLYNLTTDEIEIIENQ